MLINDSLPSKSKPVVLLTNYEKTLGRLKEVVGKLRTNPKLINSYKNIIKVHLESDIIKETGI